MFNRNETKNDIEISDRKGIRRKEERTNKYPGPNPDIRTEKTSVPPLDG